MPWFQTQKRAEIDGTAREAGYVFFRPEGWAPPADTVRDADDATRWVDIPAAVPIDDAVVEQMNVGAIRDGRAGHGYPRGDDDIVRPVSDDFWLAQREKIDAAGAEGAGVATAPRDVEAMEAHAENVARRRGLLEPVADEHVPAEPLPPATDTQFHAVPENPALPIAETNEVRQDMPPPVPDPAAPRVPRPYPNP
jgi:hypothetical protein